MRPTTFIPMNLTPEELAAAKAALRTEPLTPADLVLMKKYPRHTLTQAREIDATAPVLPFRAGTGCTHHEAGHDFQMAQAEYHGIYDNGLR